MSSLCRSHGKHVCCGCDLLLHVAAVTASTALATTSEIVPLFISASSHPSQQGFVRIINHSDQGTASAPRREPHSER